MEYGDFFLISIKIDLGLWVTFFICWFIKAVIKRESIKFSIGEFLAWFILSIGTSVFGPVTLSIVCLFTLAFVMAKIWDFFVEHWLDGIVKFLSKKITLKDKQVC